MSKAPRAEKLLYNAIVNVSIMKRLTIHCLAILFGSALLGFNALADLEVSASVQIHAKAEFDAPLAAHGTWVTVGSYGRCWRPAGVAVEWRPYCSGEWVWTDCGWYWASDEPWAWACYHYGYWAFDPAYGWVWVPDVEWAPAWVSWRVGGGYIGWAPLAPPGVFFARSPAPDQFVFVANARFAGPIRPGAVVMKDTAVFRATSAVEGVKSDKRMAGGTSARVMFNHGPAPELVQKATGRHFAAVPIGDALHRTPGPAAPRHVAEGKAKTGGHNVPLSGDRGKKDSDWGQDHGPDSNDHSSGSPFDSGRGGGRDGGFGHGHGRGR